MLSKRHWHGHNALTPRRTQAGEQGRATAPTPTGHHAHAATHGRTPRTKPKRADWQTSTEKRDSPDTPRRARSHRTRWITEADTRRDQIATAEAPAGTRADRRTNKKAAKPSRGNPAQGGTGTSPASTPANDGENWLMRSKPLLTAHRHFSRLKITHHIEKVKPKPKEAN